MTINSLNLSYSIMYSIDLRVIISKQIKKFKSPVSVNVNKIKLDFFYYFQSNFKFIKFIKSILLLITLSKKMNL